METNGSLEIYPKPNPDKTKPTYWGKPITIPNYGTVGIEVRQWTSNQGKQFTGLMYTFRNENNLVDLGTIRAPLYINAAEPIIPDIYSPMFPQIFASSNDSSPSKEVIMTGFPSRTLDSTLRALDDDRIPNQNKEAIFMFLLLRTVQTIQKMRENKVIHGDLKANNIIIDDATLSVHLIDPYQTFPSNFPSTRKINYDAINFNELSRIFEIFTNPALDLATPLLTDEAFKLNPHENINTETQRIIDVTKEKLKQLGYDVDAQSTPNEIADILAKDNKKIQLSKILMRIKTTDQYLDQLIAAMDHLVATAPTVKIPEMPPQEDDDPYGTL